MAVEQPAYEVLEKDGRFEVRHYAGYITASVRVPASGYRQATNIGFDPLAGYIFGGNHRADRIAMTAPVTAERAPGERIAMTVPVTASEADDGYVVSFTMPSQYAMEDLPTPNDPRVAFAQVGQHDVAAVRFAGYLNDKTAAKATHDLEAWMAAQGLERAGDPVAAQYDAPWKPGLVRRNEILIPIATERPHSP